MVVFCIIIIIPCSSRNVCALARLVDHVSVRFSERRTANNPLGLCMKANEDKDISFGWT